MGHAQRRHHSRCLPAVILGSATSGLYQPRVVEVINLNEVLRFHPTFPPSKHPSAPKKKSIHTRSQNHFETQDKEALRTDRGTS